MKTNEKNVLSYKGYWGRIEFSERDEVFHGKVVGIKSLISFEGDSVKAIKADFRNSINEYLEYCKDEGIQPEKSFKGSFNVRVGSELHRLAALEASVRGVSLNSVVEEALRQYVRHE